MPIRRRGGAGGAGGGGLQIRTPVDEFTGATIAACRTARDDYFATTAGIAALTQFQANSSLAIVLNPTSTTTNTWQTYAPGQSGMAYDNAQWLGRGNVAQGDAGPGGSDAVVDATNVDPLIQAYTGGIAGLTITDGQIPAGIARDAEIAAAIANLRGGVDAAYDTLEELADALIESGQVTGTKIVLTRQGGDTLDVDVTALMGGGLTQAQVNQLIQAALDAAVTGNTETGIDVAHNADGTIDFVVTAGGGLSLATVLAAIMGSPTVSVDRSTPNQIALSSTGGGAAALAWQDEGGDLAAVTGVNLVGEGVQGVVVNGILTITVSGGGAPAPVDHTAYINWSDDDVGTEAEALAGNNSDNGVLTIPARAANGWIIMYSPVSEGFPTTIHLDGNLTPVNNGFTREADAMQIDVSGTAHYVLVSTSEQNAMILGTGSRTYTLGY